MNNSIIYRKPDFSDIENISDLFHNIITSSFAEYPQAAIDGYKKAWTTENLERRISARSDLLMVAFHNNLPVGLLSGPPPEAGVGTVVWLIVDEQARGLKVGTRLFELACEHFRNLNCHKLKLTASNQGAREFYLKLGMREEGFHPNHWWNADFWAFGIDL